MKKLSSVELDDRPLQRSEVLGNIEERLARLRLNLTQEENNNPRSALNDLQIN